jgi:hypothetical protein
MHRKIQNRLPKGKPVLHFAGVAIRTRRVSVFPQAQKRLVEKRDVSTEP